jgi:hypothetical protein
MICDCGVKPLPSTVNRTEFVSLEMVPGESEVICATGSVVWQSFHSNIARQVQPDNSRQSCNEGNANRREGPAETNEGRRHTGLSFETICILHPNVRACGLRCAMGRDTLKRALLM